MEQKNIGKLIQKIRKEKSLTQEQLGELLGVSSKTISKWETGNSLPDITILKKISKEFEITIEELLDGEIANKNNRNKIKPNALLMIIICISLLIITVTIIYKKENTEEFKTTKNNCTVIRTYNIKNIKESNDGNYRYITISEYQVEGVFTIKLPSSITKDLKEGLTYIFTFKTNQENIDVTTDKLFNNSEVINIKYTDKLGMESESKSYCDK